MSTRTQEDELPNNAARSRSVKTAEVTRLPTRKPTGIPSWPIMLVAGVQKSGKTVTSAEASASDLIDRTFWFGFGEKDPDEYAPLGRFEIVQFEHTYRDLINKLKLAVAEPRGDSGKPHMIVIDSLGRLWALLSDMAQDTANTRWQKRSTNQDKPIPEDGIAINSDLWNLAKQRWNHVLDLLREFDGPVIITALLEEITVFDGDKPTKDKTWKVQAQKNLTTEVDAIVEMRVPYWEGSDTYITGVRSLRFKPEKKHTPYPNFTVDDLWRKLGLADGPVGKRTYAAISAETSTAAEQHEDQRLALAAERRRELLPEIASIVGGDTAQIKTDWFNDHGHDITTTTDIGALELLRDDLRAQASQPVGGGADHLDGGPKADAA